MGLSRLDSQDIEMHLILTEILIADIAEILENADKFVPYTGANADVDLGAQGIEDVNFINITGDISSATGGYFTTSGDINTTDGAITTETGSVTAGNSLIAGLFAQDKITVSLGSITDDSGTISFDDENIKTTGIIDPTLTTGSVLFIDANGITEDNFNLFWDNAINELQPNLLKITSDGTQAAPALKFNDTNTGFFKLGDSVRLSINNSTIMTVNATGLDVTGNETLTGDLTINTDALFVDATQKAAGIGTATLTQSRGFGGPGQKAVLWVYDDEVGKTTSIIVAGENGSAIQFTDENLLPTCDFGFIGNSLFFVNRSAAGPIFFRTNNVDRLTITNTEINSKVNFKIGSGVAGVDYTLTFDGETNDGVITWMEDEDYFQFADKVVFDLEVEIDGDLNHDGSNIGFYGTTPAAQSSAYTRNATIVEDRTLLASASATTLNNNNVLAALIADLQAIGLIA